MDPPFLYTTQCDRVSVRNHSFSYSTQINIYAPMERPHAALGMSLPKPIVQIVAGYLHGFRMGLSELRRLLQDAFQPANFDAPRDPYDICPVVRQRVAPALTFTEYDSLLVVRFQTSWEGRY